MTSYPPLFDLVADGLDAVEARMQTHQEVFEPLAGAINLLLDSGGKRIRPALALLTARLFPESDSDKVVSLAAAVEMLHTATLVHDDVVDGAFLRRGKATLNASWSSGATILAGDFIFARAAYFAAATGNVRVMQIFSETLMTICEGELRQLYAIRDWRQPKDAYYERINGKTAALFAAATEASAVLGNGSEEEIDAMRQFGYSVGMAFQVMDDLLDFVGDVSTVGKPVGNDLRQGTVTLPVFHFLQNHPEALQVMEATSNGHDNGDPMSQLIADIRQSSAIEATRQEAVQFIADAQVLLRRWPDSVYRQAMEDVANYVVARTY